MTPYEHSRAVGVQMTVEAERRAERALLLVESMELRAAEIKASLRTARVFFMDDAISAGWGWKRIADKLGQSDSAVRQYYSRNRRRVRGGDV